MYVLMYRIYIKCAMENNRGYEVTNRMVRSVTGTAAYTKLHIRNSVKIPGNYDIQQPFCPEVPGIAACTVGTLSDLVWRAASCLG